jgi:hypothetical protein
MIAVNYSSEGHGFNPSAKHLFYHFSFSVLILSLPLKNALGDLWKVLTIF